MFVQPPWLPSYSQLQPPPHWAPNIYDEYKIGMIGAPNAPAIPQPPISHPEKHHQDGDESEEAYKIVDKGEKGVHIEIDEEVHEKQDDRV